MLKLKMSPEKALFWLKTVNHVTFQEALGEHWIVTEGEVKPQSALWLFCWAKSGMNSADVADHVHRLFNGILEVPFETFDAKIPHEWAQEMRYAPGDISQDLKRLLS